MKLLLLKGLPASGKSTYAMELVKDGWVRSNKDDLRALLHGSKWTKANEKEVCAVRDAIVRQALTDGRNVVVDDTNYHPSHEETLREIVHEFKKIGRPVEFEIKEFDTDVEECIKRDLHRGPKAVGEQVIRRMWRDHVQPVQSRFPGEGDQAVIFDIDGTLAIKGDRGVFDWDKVGVDLVNRPIRQLLWVLQRSGYKIIIFSGRDAVCRPETEEWLRTNEISYVELHMRAIDDNRKDVEIKEEFYDACKERFDITYAVDDRAQVCRMWHTKGLTLLKVGDPDVEF